MKLALKLAWREIRHNQRFSSFFLLNLALGLIGFVTLDSFKNALESSIDGKSRVLLGGDLSISARRELNPAEERIIDSLLGEKRAESRFVELYSMVASGVKSRLVQVKAIDERYPFYGEILLASHRPPSPTRAKTLMEGPRAWVSPELLSELNLAPGQTIQIGEVSFRVDDVVEDDGASVAEIFRLAPRIYIGLSQLSPTRLVRKGSTVTYGRLYRLPDTIDLDPLAARLDEQLKDPAIRVKSHRSASLQIAKSAKYLTDYLGLAALVAFFLSGLGAAYLFRNYLARRLREVAILMSLGVTRSRAQSIYLFELVLLGALATIPAGLGSQLLLPLFARVIQTFLPFSLVPGVSLPSLLLGSCFGTLGSLLLCLPTLRTLRRLSPSELFREGTSPKGQFEWRSVVTVIPALFFFWALAIWLSKSWRVGSVFIASLLGSVSLLTLVGYALIGSVRGRTLGLGFTKRIGLRNLVRNRLGTLSCFLAISVGTVLVNLVVQTQTNLRMEISGPKAETLPSFFAFDIQEDQVEGLKKLVASQGAKLTGLSPTIRARIDRVNDTPFEKEVDSRPAKTREEEEERGFRNRGVNLTFRSVPLASETIVAGTFTADVKPGTTPIPVSVEKEFAKRLNWKLGDVVRFDIQGVPVEAKVASLRKIKWTSFEPNFFVEFPAGALEGAPKTYLASLTIAKDRKAGLQNQIVAGFSNVSLVDVSKALSKINEVISQMALALSFMAFLSLFAGLVVLFSIANHEAYLRRYDISLLKVLGAEVPVILNITRWEFGVIGFAAAFLGCGVSYGVSYLFAYFIFEQTWQLSLGLPLALVGGITLTCVLVAEMATRRTIFQSPKTLLQVGK